MKNITIFVLSFFLGTLAAGAFLGLEKANAAEPYNSAQLKYLFSGIEVEGDGQVLCGGSLP